MEGSHRTAPEPVLELRGLTKSFGDTVAVAGVTGVVLRGEYVCLLGPSGCGKTTLLRLIAGFEEPSSGELLLEGRSLAGVPPERRDVNVVFQSYALFPHLTVRENVAFGPTMKKVEPAQVDGRVAEALRLVRMDALAARYPRQLSGGQQQRVALARALVNRPRVLLLDEPLSALDRSLRLAMQDELKALQREIGVAFVHVTHDQSEALSLADRVVVMRAGGFEQVGSPREIYERPRSRFVAEFLGSSNLLEGTWVSPGVVETDGGLRLLVDGSSHPPGPAQLAVRPEAIEVVLASAPGGGSDVDGTVESLSFNGPLTEIRVRVQGHVLRALLPASAGRTLSQGARVTVCIPRAAIVALDPEPGPGPSAR